MTALIHAFPSPPAFVSAMHDEARREAIVEAARAILRSAADHTDADMIEACYALQDYGDWRDHTEADAMLQAIQMRQRRDEFNKQREREESQNLRAALMDMAILAAFGAVLVLWIYVGGK